MKTIKLFLAGLRPAKTYYYDCTQGSYLQTEKGELVSKKWVLQDFTSTMVFSRLKRGTCIRKLGSSKFDLYNGIFQTQKGNLYSKTGLFKILLLQRCFADWEGEFVTKIWAPKDITSTIVFSRLERGICIQKLGFSRFHFYNGIFQTQKGNLISKTGLLNVLLIHRYFADWEGEFVSKNWAPKDITSTMVSQ